MFSALRQGNIIYILDKRGVPTLKIGQVTSVSEPRAKYNTSFPSQPFSMETTVDIMAKAGEESYEFKQLASQASVSSYEGVIVSESRDAIARIDMFLKYFRDIFNGFIAKVTINFALLAELTLVNIY